MLDLTITVVCQDDISPDELDELMLGLRQQVLDLDVHDAVREPLADAPPVGSKSVAGMALETLVVTLPPLVVRPLMRVVETWLSNRPVRTVKVSIGKDKIELENVSRDGQDKLIDAFIKQHETD